MPSASADHHHRSEVTDHVRRDQSRLRGRRAWQDPRRSDRDDLSGADDEPEPVFPIGWQLDEALKYHTDLDSSGRRKRALEMLRLVRCLRPSIRLTSIRTNSRAACGSVRSRSLCCELRHPIADEPTTALDVTIQRRYSTWMEGLKRKLDTAIVLITHNLGVVSAGVRQGDRDVRRSDHRVCPVHDIFHSPEHPYTLRPSLHPEVGP